MSPFAFVVMPFDEEFRDLYEFGIKEPLTKLDYRVARNDDPANFSADDMLDRIKRSIISSDIIVAVTDGANANVMWEIGFAMAHQKPCALLTKDPHSIPFNLKHSDHIIYTNVTDLGGKLSKWAANSARAIRGESAAEDLGKTITHRTQAGVSRGTEFDSAAHQISTRLLHKYDINSSAEGGDLFEETFTLRVESKKLLKNIRIISEAEVEEFVVSNDGDGGIYHDPAPKTHQFPLQKIPDLNPGEHIDIELLEAISHLRASPHFVSGSQSSTMPAKPPTSTLKTSPRESVDLSAVGYIQFKAKISHAEGAPFEIGVRIANNRRVYPVLEPYHLSGPVELELTKNWRTMGD
ncbi:MAG: hypothetical protein GC150_09625 [Rhizobiales bacterium]|nr:hypothetical protein [Hyphomicrobiales bacterium]